MDGTESFEILVEMDISQRDSKVSDSELLRGHLFQDISFVS